MLVDCAGVEVEDLRCHLDLRTCTGDRLTDVARLDPRQLLAVFLDERREPAQQSGPIGRCNRLPRRESGFRRGNRAVGLVDAGLFELGDRLLGGGVQNCQHCAI